MLLSCATMASIATTAGVTAVYDDDIDGVPLQSLPSTTGWLSQSAPPPPSPFVPVSMPAIAPVSAINPIKAALFASGAVPILSVNRVEQERAAAEDKARRQAEEAKVVYAEFLASFAVEQQQTAPPKPKSAKPAFTAFVRGGTLGGENTAAITSNTPAKRAEPYPPALASSVAAAEPPWKRLRPASPPPPAIESAFSPPPAPAGRGKQRNIDLFLAELKQRQADPQSVREEVQPATPATTNMFIAGLPLSTTESDLADEMVRFGDIASVKLLYPRTDEVSRIAHTVSTEFNSWSDADGCCEGVFWWLQERARTTMNGFVAYMLRRDAEDAMRCTQSTQRRTQHAPHHDASASLLHHCHTLTVC